MSSTHDTLVRMANDIAKNFAVMGDVDAAKATADHIHQFWDPRMKKAIFAERAGLGAIAARAIEILKTEGTPGPQTRATEFSRVNGGRMSDAG